MIYGYCRVSTAKQVKGNSLDEQEQALKQAGAQEIIRESYTGTKTDRPLFSLLLDKLQSGDTLIVTKLDRFARNASEGIATVQGLVDRGVRVNILNMGMADNTPNGKLMVTILLGFAEFERDMIVERTQSGKAMAKANNPNFKDGRPKGYTSIQLDHAMNLLETNSYNQTAALTGISVSTLQREKRRRKAKVI